MHLDKHKYCNQVLEMQLFIIHSVKTLTVTTIYVQTNNHNLSITAGRLIIFCKTLNRLQSNMHCTSITAIIASRIHLLIFKEALKKKPAK